MSSSSTTRQRNGGHRPRGPSISEGINAYNTYTDKTAIGETSQPSSSTDSEATPAQQMRDNAQEVLGLKTASSSTSAARTSRKGKGKETASAADPNRPKIGELAVSHGLLDDIKTFRWMTQPASSAKMAGVIIVFWLACKLFAPQHANPFEPFIFISHKIPVVDVLKSEPALGLRNDTVRYAKGYKDGMFLAFYVIVFSWLRQTTTLYMFKPFAAWWGIKNERKRERFMEQGYSFLYWGSASALGLYVMAFQDSWWFKLEHFWLQYPHWMMRPELKTYYLLQFSYWLQQALVMLLRLEAPRKDYYELIAHHLVTLWLIWWSYLVNLTMIGTTVFVCMDIPDTWLAMAKGFNYLDLNNLATTVFGTLMFIWTYFRIWLSARTLWSVWYEFDLIPAHARNWSPQDGWWLVPWMKYQIFTPLFLLLLLNVFWYILMWRVMIRALQGAVEDVREQGEYDGEE